LCRNVLIVLLCSVCFILGALFPPSVLSRNSTKEGSVGGILFAKSDLAINLKEKDCTREPLVLVYNRIPKAGSTTFMALAKKISVQNGFKMMTPEPYFDHAKLRRAIFNAVSSQTRTLIVNHFFFPEILYSDRVAYMNMMRDPVNRTVSDYYYLRYSTRRGQKAIKYREQYGDISIDDCYLKRTKYSGKCEIQTNYQASFFCGMESHICHHDGNKQLKRDLAMENMEKYFSIGVEERYEDTLEMLEITYPHFFKGIGALYEATKGAPLNSNEHPTASDQVIHHLESANDVDYILYKKANELLSNYLKRCK
jgi:hypothetical protein